MSGEVIDRLYRILQSRKNTSPQESYVASLYQRGLHQINRKVMEEAYETVQSSQALETGGQTREEFIGEMCDLLFHVLVLASYENIELDELYRELERRMQMSGHEEKNRRNKN